MKQRKTKIGGLLQSPRRSLSCDITRTANELIALASLNLPLSLNSSLGDSTKTVCNFPLIFPNSLLICSRSSFSVKGSFGELQIKTTNWSIYLTNVYPNLNAPD